MSRFAFVCALLCVALLGACAHSPSRSSFEAVGKAAEARSREKPIITPITGLQGTVTRVNLVAQFAVVTFATAPLPEAGRVLSVYRGGLKVGQIRITPPAPVMLNVTGDITGDVKVGDEVREN